MVANDIKVCLTACERCNPTLPSSLSPTRDTKKISYAQAVGILSNTRNVSPRKKTSSTQPSRLALPKIHIGIANTVYSHLYIDTQAPHGPPNSSDPKIRVGASNVQVVLSTTTATLPIPQRGNDIPCEVHIMPSFTNTLVDIGPICDACCTVTFTEHNVTVFFLLGKPILTVWRETVMPKMWRFSLCLSKYTLPAPSASAKRAILQAYSAYNLPSVEALVCYLNAATGFLTKSTWLKAIKARNLRRDQG